MEEGESEEPSRYVQLVEGGGNGFVAAHGQVDCHLRQPDNIIKYSFKRAIFSSYRLLVFPSRPSVVVVGPAAVLLFVPLEELGAGLVADVLAQEHGGLFM